MASTSETAALVALGLTKQYGSHKAVDNVDLSLKAGSTLALIGHNGAGKTTLMKLVLGLIRPSAGELAVFGRQPSSAGLDYRRWIGFLPENVAFHDELTGAQTMRFYARLKEASLRQCGDLLERVGLTFAATRRVKTYSKGMRQRLGLAQALLGEPRLLLLDEPTTGLDPASRTEFFAMLRELAGRGATILISSHILTELEAQTDLVAIMNTGRLAAFGPLDALRRKADLPVVVTICAPKGVAAAVNLVGALAERSRIAPDGRAAEIACREENKMRIVSILSAPELGIADIDIARPGLGEIYRHFSPEPAGQA